MEMIQVDNWLKTIQLDKKSLSNLKWLYSDVIDAREVISKRTDFSFKTLLPTAPAITLTLYDNQTNRQQVLRSIDTHAHAKASGRIIRRIYKKYHVMPTDDYIKKLESIAKKHPRYAPPLKDMAHVKHEHVIATFTKIKGHALPLISVTDEISDKTFRAMIHDFDKDLQDVLPQSIIGQMNIDEMESLIEP